MASSSSIQHNASPSSPSPLIPLKKRTRRRILPLETTPSLIIQSPSLQGRVVDTEYAEIKGTERIIDYYLKCLLEMHLDVSFERGPTLDQGHRAKKSYQAAHHSLLPNSLDPALEKFIQKVGLTGITPTKSGPYLMARAALSEEETEKIASHHPDEKMLRELLGPRLPKGADLSSLAGTSLYLFSNATIDNPDESNQLDSLLERKIVPFLEAQQRLRKEGSIDAVSSTQNLVKWLLEFYQGSLDSCEKRKEYLQRATSLLGCIDDKENALSPEILIADLMKLLTLKLNHLPSHAVPKSLTQSIHPFLDQNLPEIKKQLSALITTLQTKTSLFEMEANAHLKLLASCLTACTIPELQTTLFGIYEGGARRAPTSEEMRAQLFDMLRVDPSYREGTFKRQRHFSKATKLF